MRTWTESLHSVTGTGGPAQSGLPSPQQVLDNVFDFAEQLLAMQRDFATRILAAGMEVKDATSQTAREAVESVTARAMAPNAATTEKVVNAGWAGGPRINR
jgi:hypothetical protein